MKLGCAVSTYPTRFGPIIFKDGDLPQNAAVLQRNGYECVDLFVKETTRAQLREYRDVLAAHGLGVTTMFAIYLGENGVTLAERDKARQARNLDLVKQQIDNAVELGAKGLGMGFVRGMHGEDESEQDALARIAWALAQAGEYAQSVGSCILLEPINRYEINTLNSAVKTMDFVRDNQLPGVLLQPDLFHMNIEDGPLDQTLRYVAPLIGNLHISSSNRRAVGEGHFDFVAILQTLLAVGYNGPLTFEGFADQPEAALRKTAENLRRCMKEAGG
ncbi:MAG TPA: sugar phosphate isomerase/epimerase [Candidatus Fournierella merdigallinarum]|nr:sugar phosphate isomerase/epimerase [Candidatus Fournierella merdigallinarum]